MPWTFAHPAAVLPLRRMGLWQLPLSALIAGSLAPDLGYYLGRNDLASFAHTPAGLLLFCMPAVLLLVGLWVRLRRLLITPLPQPHRAALASLAPTALWPAPAAVRVAIAGLMGAATHVVWDSFTHANGAVVQWFQPLQQEVFAMAGRSFPVYNVLQHASTALGLAVLVLAYRRWLRRTAPTTQAPKDRLRSYSVFGICVISSAAAGIGIALCLATAPTPFPTILVRAVIYGTTVFFIAYMAVAIRIWARQRAS